MVLGLGQRRRQCLHSRSAPDLGGVRGPYAGASQRRPDPGPAPSAEPASELQVSPLGAPR